MEDKDVVQDLRDRLIKIETLLEKVIDINHLEIEKLRIEFDEKYKVQNHRIADLEDNQKWQGRTLAGSILTIVTGVILFFIKNN